MAFLRSIFPTSMLLLAFLVIASATDYYGYGPAPDLEKSKPVTDYKPQPSKPDYEVPNLKGKEELVVDYKSQPTKPDYEVPKPQPTKPDYEVPKPKGKDELETDYKPQPTKPDYEVPKPNPAKPDYEVPKPKGKDEPETDYKPQSTKPDYEVPEPNPTKPDYEVPKPKGKDEPVTDYKPQPTKSDYEMPKPQPTKPDYEVPKPKGKDELPLLLTVIGVQGVVLCKSGSNYFPIQGAVARVTCGCVDELGYETGPISVLSHVTDSKGYFFATLSLGELGSKYKLTECKAYLESSPLETCKVPTDVNHGISGARLSSYRLLENKIKLYSVAPFFCTSQSKPAPNGY